MPRKWIKEKWDDLLASWGLTRTKAPEGGSRRELQLFIPQAQAASLCVGTLALEGGEYVFTYSEAFRRRPDLPPISAFPDTDAEYRSATLWQFFQVRVPPVDRPDVEEVLREKHIDDHDTFSLLTALGRKVVSSPYELVPSQ